MGTQKKSNKEKGPLGRSEKRGMGALAPTRKPGYLWRELSQSEHTNKDSDSFEDVAAECEPLDLGDEFDLEEEAAQYEEERYHPDEFPLENQEGGNTQGGRRQRPHFPPLRRRPKAKSLPPAAFVPPSPPPFRPALAPSVPPLPPPCPEQLPPSTSRFSPDFRRQMRMAFPVFEGDGGQQRIYAQVEFSQLKELAESVRKYGITASFTISILERLARDHMTPADWQDIARATLPTPGKFVEWKALWYDAAQDQARSNQCALTREQQTWTFEMLTGQGPHANDQVNLPWGVYTQVSQTAIKAWKNLTSKGETSGQLTKIIQGSQEPFADFVARVIEAANKIFGDSEAAKPLIEQLVFEQATQECRAAIAPRKSKGLQDWLKVCRELGGPLTNAGLAAAILRTQQTKRGTDVRTCFQCGKPGHLKKNCPAPAKASLELCRRCGKGYHKTELCRSVRDIKGKLLPPMAARDSQNEEQKNGSAGPWSRGPKKF